MYPKIHGHVNWPKDHNKTLIMEMSRNFLAMHVINESKRLTGVHHAINQMQCPEPLFISISVFFSLHYFFAICTLVLFDYCSYLLGPCKENIFLGANWGRGGVYKIR